MTSLQSVITLLFCVLYMVSADLHLSIMEEIPHNTIISDIKKEAGLDQQYDTDILDLLQFSFLTQPQVDGTHFGINQTGHLYSVGRIDKESMCPQQPDCTVIFYLAIRPIQYFQIIKISMDILDINDNAPEIKVNTLTPSGVSEVMENLPENTFVAHISVTDKDTGVNSQVTCVMENDQNFNLVNLYRAEYQVMTEKVFDREVVDEYQLMILCSDQGQITLTTSSSIKVQIIDANDHTPVFTSEKYSTVIEENNALETTLAQLQATDSDVGDNGQIIYEILPEYKNLVNIDSNTGLVTAAASFDYEQISFIMIVVEASDRGVPPRTSTCSLEVTFLDEDDEYPVFSQNTYNFVVYENEPAFTKVGTVMAIDADSDLYNKFQYTLDPYSEDVDTFHIDSDTGVMVTQTVLDREVHSVYVMTVMAVPQNKPEYSSSASVTVHVVRH